MAVVIELPRPNGDQSRNIPGEEKELPDVVLGVTYMEVVDLT
jgi:hypothetical protein